MKGEIIIIPIILGLLLSSQSNAQETLNGISPDNYDNQIVKAMMYLIRPLINFGISTGISIYPNNVILGISIMYLMYGLVPTLQFLIAMFIIIKELLKRKVVI